MLVKHLVPILKPDLRSNSLGTVGIASLDWDRLQRLRDFGSLGVRGAWQVASGELDYFMVATLPRTTHGH